MSSTAFGTLMVALDGSEFAEGALEPARELARKSGAALHLVSVHERGPGWAEEMWPAGEMDTWREEYLSGVARQVADALPGTVTTAHPEGDVAECLLEEADAVGAGLLLLSSHGRGRIARSWLGSVAVSLLHRADVPLLVLRPHEDAGEGGTAPSAWRTPRTILVALDGSEDAEAIVEPAVRLARVFGARLHLVRVAPFPRAYSSPYIPHTVQINQELVSAEEERARAYLAEARERLVPEGVEADTAVVVTPDPARGILAEAAASGADVLALATHHGTLHRLALGSTADKVVRASARPVLLVRATGD